MSTDEIRAQHNRPRCDFIVYVGMEEKARFNDVIAARHYYIKMVTKHGIDNCQLIHHIS